MKSSDVLQLGGFLVCPAEIASELRAHPCVTSAQVVSMPTATGERAVAFVIPRPEVEFDPIELQAHCSRKLAKYKVPARVVALDEFPVTVSAGGCATVSTSSTAK